jgi:hypothetical protein
MPEPLKLEVKVTRGDRLSISTRDLEGLGEEGYLAFLVTDRLANGPRWVFIPRNHLTAGTYAQARLVTLGNGILPDLLKNLNRLWTDWVLDRPYWEVVLNQQNAPPARALNEMLQHRNPRESALSGHLREGMAANALTAFQEGIDTVANGNKGPQQEGLVHQHLLAYALKRLGYQVTVNPVGVPDLVATQVEQ